MNIKDNAVVDLTNALYVDREGNVIFGDGHAKFVSQFFGIDILMPEREAISNQERLLVYENYCSQVRDISLIDFLIRFFGYDRCCYKTIISSRINLYDFYFNHYLDEYGLIRMPAILLDENTGMFYSPSVSAEIRQKEFDLKKEADSIKNSVPKRERYRHYK